MAISATNTRQSQLAVESALQERRRKEALQRKQQEEREAKDREQERKLRLRRLEEEKREQERQLRLEQERQAKLLALQRKEEAQREALRHGPKKAAKLAAAGATATGSSGSGGGPKWPMSASAVAKARALDDSDGESPGLGLTREELRKKKQEAELRKIYNTSKKPTQSSRSLGKNGLRLPGGALNVVKPEEEVEDPNPSQGSVRDRLLNKPNMLTKLNIVKKDQRTVFEQLEDARAAKKVLDGHEALQFDSWFSAKKKEADKKVSPPPVSSTASQSGTNSPAPRECLWDGSFVSSLISLSCTQVLNHL